MLFYSEPFLSISLSKIISMMDFQIKDVELELRVQEFVILRKFTLLNWPYTQHFKNNCIFTTKFCLWKDMKGKGKIYTNFKNKF